MSEDSRITKTAQSLLGAAIEKKVEYLNEDHWVGYSSAQLALSQMEDLFRMPRKLRMPNLLIKGVPGNGKTHILQHFVELHPGSDRPDSDTSSLPVSFVSAPSIADAGALYGRILDTLAVPFLQSASPLKKFDLVVVEAAKTGVKMIIIDEFHDLMNGTPLKQRQVITGIKDLSNATKICIVASGTDAAHRALAVDEQLDSRFSVLPLPLWTDKAQYARLLASFEKILPFPDPSYLANPAKSEMIRKYAGEVIGKISKLIYSAAIAAIRADEKSISIGRLEFAGKTLVNISGSK